MMKKITSLVAASICCISGLTAQAITAPKTIWEKDAEAVEGTRGDGNCNWAWATALQLPGSAFDNIDSDCFIEIIYSVPSSSSTQWISINYPWYTPTDGSNLGCSDNEELNTSGLSDKSFCSYNYELRDMNNSAITILAFVSESTVANLRKFGFVIKGGDENNWSAAMPFYIWRVRLIPVDENGFSSLCGQAETLYPSDSENVVKGDMPTWSWATALTLKGGAFSNYNTPIWIDVEYEGEGGGNYIYSRIPGGNDRYNDKDAESRRFIASLGDNKYKSRIYIPIPTLDILKQYGLIFKAGDGESWNAMQNFTINSLKVIPVTDPDSKYDLWDGYLICSDSDSPDQSLLTSLGLVLARTIKANDEIRVYGKNVADIDQVGFFHKGSDWAWQSTAFSTQKDNDNRYFTIPANECFMTNLGTEPNGMAVGYNGLKMTRITHNEKTSISTGVEAIEIADENTPVEYFNLQGIKVLEPENGIYIMRQGNKVKKIVISR